MLKRNSSKLRQKAGKEINPALPPAGPSEREKWLSAWSALDAIAYRESLRYGPKLSKKGKGMFVLQVLSVASGVHDASAHAGERDVFADYWAAITGGRGATCDYERETERAFARAVAPLFFSREGRETLHRILDCVEQAKATPLTKQQRARHLLKVAEAARNEAVKNAKAWPRTRALTNDEDTYNAIVDSQKVTMAKFRKLGISPRDVRVVISEPRPSELPALARILEFFNADPLHGKPMTAREAKPLLRKLGVMFEPMKARGPDKKPRGKKGSVKI